MKIKKYYLTVYGLTMLWVANYTNMRNFHPLEVVDRGSETQLQVSEDQIILFNSLWVNNVYDLQIKQI